jgi:hypothetical protein
MSTTPNVIALFDILGFRDRIRSTPPERFGAILDGKSSAGPVVRPCGFSTATWF